MFRRISIAVLVLVALGGSIALAQSTFLSSNHRIAQNSPGSPEPSRSEELDHPKPNKGEWLKDLDLTPEQTQKMQAIHDRNKDQIAQRAQAMKQAQRELRNLMAGSASQEEVRVKYRQVESLRQEVDRLRFDTMLAVREILTLEQRQKMAERMDRRRGRFDHPMKGRPDMPPEPN
ncbi:MAG: Spy/CpxP family protein refolding chaperone [Scytolyngbya sp. HA4215-MV1]|jgi:Spy/CpxP family protein refolding chaperone|nr:Spy/CpxP family protein refolding chaperone [Scytolyngbya sp. HA4215-MV1]